MEIAQGLKTANTRGINEIEQNQIRELYKEILEVNDLSKCKVDQLMQVLKPESLFERFAARKANKISAGKDFLEIKGQKL